MKIITIRQPFASALLTGTYDAEHRKYRLSGPTLIHAAAKPGMSPDACAKWLRERGDESAAQALEWQAGLSEIEPADPLSDLAVTILASVAEFGEIFPFGYVVGYVADWEPVREGNEWANKPIGAVRFPVTALLPTHRGVLGLIEAPKIIVSSVCGLIPQKGDKSHG